MLPIHAHYGLRVPLDGDDYLNLPVLHHGCDAFLWQHWINRYISSSRFQDSKHRDQQFRPSVHADANQLVRLNPLVD
ncbi:hypothetical protein D3C73_852340 [compost metagenome]